MKTTLSSSSMHSSSSAAIRSLRVTGFILQPLQHIVVGSGLVSEDIDKLGVQVQELSLLHSLADDIGGIIMLNLPAVTAPMRQHGERSSLGIERDEDTGCSIADVDQGLDHTP